MASFPLKPTSSNLASMTDTKLCSQITSTCEVISGIKNRNTSIAGTCALLVHTLVDSALIQDHMWCFFHPSSSHWAWMVLCRQAAAWSCTLFSLYDDALQTVSVFKDFHTVLNTQLPQCFTNTHSLGSTFSFSQLQKPDEKIKSKSSYWFLRSISVVWAFRAHHVCRSQRQQLWLCARTGAQEEHPADIWDIWVSCLWSYRN